MKAVQEDRNNSEHNLKNYKFREVNQSVKIDKINKL